MMHFYSIYSELRASTFFEHYLFILSRHLVYCVRVMSVGCTNLVRVCYVSWLHQSWCLRVMSVGCNPGATN
jgi:hypothetical protein